MVNRSSATGSMRPKLCSSLHSLGKNTCPVTLTHNFFWDGSFASRAFSAISRVGRLICLAEFAQAVYKIPFHFHLDLCCTLRAFLFDRSVPRNQINKCQSILRSVPSCGGFGGSIRVPRSKMRYITNLLYQQRHRQLIFSSCITKRIFKK